MIKIGEDWGTKFFDAKFMWKMLKTYSSLAYFAPSENVWPADQPFIEISKSSLFGIISSVEAVFTAKNKSKAIAKADLKVIEKKFNVLEKVRNNLDHPGVDVYCVYGDGLETPAKILYANDKDFPMEAEYEMGEGDGTVPKISLEACKRWEKWKDDKFGQKIFKDIIHYGMVFHGEVISDLLLYVSKVSDEEKKKN